MTEYRDNRTGENVGEIPNDVLVQFPEGTYTKVTKSVKTDDDLQAKQDAAEAKAKAEATAKAEAAAKEKADAAAKKAGK